ncbi:hypothetical protein NHX12_019608 [Muraenolepis orangiensis]|uniref:Uncharacterized protein n=1 Tax=Muraenolepis orangiensis TaxID=630683 RepID=A0A9Q0EVP9_9TELE|nr:hypothetical protein NHX12_019608 [Muraenolepis orangiensis]
MLREADVDPTLRPTELSLDQFRALADAYAYLCARDPGLASYEFREELRLKHLARRPQTEETLALRRPPSGAPFPASFDPEADDSSGKPER